MPTRQNLGFVISITAVLLGAITLPYLYAAGLSAPANVFGGFLINPIDGNSYLAKMYLGWRGSWQFVLPYTASADQGAYLFTFYLALGHLARLTGLSLPLVFHLVRVISAILMALALAGFFKATMPNRHAFRYAFALALFGSGLGWLAVPFGGFTTDLWIAETYPFLSAYASPHFTLSLAILLWVLTPRYDEQPSIGRQIPIKYYFFSGLSGFALGVINPFGVVIALLASGSRLAAGLLTRQTFSGLKPVLVQSICIFWGGVPVLVYYLWMVRLDPLLAGWNSQNLTPTPPLWDVLLSLSPAIILVIPGWFYLRSQGDLSQKSLLIWVILGFSLMYLPFSLQRRFLFAFFIPVAGMAALGLEWLTRREPRRFFLYGILILLVAIPSNLVVLSSGIFGALTRDPLLYFTRGEAQALAWIAQETDPNALILASPGSGLVIPAYTGRRVIYGHPFETVSADLQKELVLNFFAGKVSLASEGPLSDVNYIFAGPREAALGDGSHLADLPVAFANDEVKIYRVER
jgi:hypothetical protein